MNNDWIEVRGPRSLAELVAAIDPTTPIASPLNSVVLTFTENEWVTVQYDYVDADTWPYMITIESTSDDVETVRPQSLRLFGLLKKQGWAMQLTSEADDIVLT